jgi:hypothetical protein
MTPEPRHGERRTYQAGCLCPACRAAEAAYRTTLRQGHRAGRRPLGALVPAREAARLVQRLLVERFTRCQLAAHAGLERHAVPVTAGQVVRWRTVLRIRRAWRLLIGPDE